MILEITIAILTITLIILICTILFLNTIIKSYKENNEINNRTINRLYKHINDTQKELDRYEEQCKIYESEIKQFPKIEINGKYVNKNMNYNEYHVLIGDYISTTSIFTMRALQYYGIDVDVVRSGHDIIERVKNGYVYDLIFINNVFPNGESGENTLDQLKNMKYFKTPVIIHTVSDNKRDYFINECGFDEYIVKPVTIEKLKPVLQKFLKEKKKNKK